MDDLVPRLLLTGLAASVSPIAVILLISVMFRGHAHRDSLLFIAGFALTLLGVGMVMTAVLHTTGGGGKPDRADAWLDVVFGALCFAAIPMVLRKKPKPRAGEEGAPALPAWRAFTRGAVAMLVNSSTWVIYISGLHAISAADLDFADRVLGVLVLTLATLTTLIVPIALCFITPGKSQLLLEKLRDWLSTHNKAIGTGILLVFGAYLLIKGITSLA